MKYLIVSDIHGYNEYIDRLFDIINIENPNKIIILGDITSYYNDSSRLEELIDKYKDIIILIKGNCDTPSLISYDMQDYYKETINNKKFLFTHGHLLDYIPINDIDIIVSGHTHKNTIATDGTRIYFNPGSLSLPRGGTTNSYGLITDSELIIKDIDGNIIKQFKYTK